MVNWAASFLSVVLLLAILAVPAMAYIAANQVVSSSIKDGSILNRDIRQNVISSSRIKNNTILNRDIHENVISSARIRDNAILNRDIKQNVISSSRIRNGTIQNIDIAPGAAISDSKIGYSTKTSYLSIPVSELSPTREDHDYYKGPSLRIESGSGAFWAPIQLPHGAVITKLRYNAYDDSSSYYTYAKLYRISNFNPNTSNEIAELTTLPTANLSSWRPLSTNTISYATVDNNNYAYAVQVYLSGPSTNTLLAGNTVIEYTYTAPGG